MVGSYGLRFKFNRVCWGVVAMLVNERVNIMQRSHSLSTRPESVFGIYDKCVS